MIRTVEIRVAGLVAFHQAVKLAFANSVAGVELVGHQIGCTFGDGFGLARLGEQGLERADFCGEVGAVGLREGLAGGERGEIGRAEVEDGH